GRIVSTKRFIDPATANVSVDWNNRYDSLGNLLSMTEPGMSTHHTEYDEDGNPIESWWQDGLVRHITRTRYDGFGRVTDERLIRSLSGAEEIENVDRFAYDRLSGDSSQPDSDVTGRLSWIETDGVGSVFFAYDSFGRTSSTS